MPSLSTIFEWFRDPDNRGAVQVIIGALVVLVGWATGLLGRLHALLRGKPPEPPKPLPPRQTARDGGVNVGGDVHGDVTITGKTLGTEHPDHALHLSNLAGLLQATGRHAEAEPLYRQALATTEKTLGTEHPAYAARLNNLAKLLQETGRHAEAEPLYRQALAIQARIIPRP